MGEANACQKKKKKKKDVLPALHKSTIATQQGWQSYFSDPCAALRYLHYLSQFIGCTEDHPCNIAHLHNLSALTNLLIIKFDSH